MPYWTASAQVKPCRYGRIAACKLSDRLCLIVGADLHAIAERVLGVERPPPSPTSITCMEWWNTFFLPSYPFFPRGSLTQVLTWSILPRHFDRQCIYFCLTNSETFWMQAEQYASYYLFPSSCNIMCMQCGIFCCYIILFYRIISQAVLNHVAFFLSLWSVAINVASILALYESSLSPLL